MEVGQGAKIYDTIKVFLSDRVPLKVQFENNSNQIQDNTISEAYNDKCIITEFCPTCRVSQPTLKIHIRGLYESSLFDRNYIYTTQDNGEVMYLGEQTSLIMFDKGSHRWIWRDSKNNQSLATSNSSYESLLMGKHFVDFSLVKNDKWSDGLIRPLKLSTCNSTQFTCDNGLCIDILSRCDLTVTYYLLLAICYLLSVTYYLFFNIHYKKYLSSQPII